MSRASSNEVNAEREKNHLRPRRREKSRSLAEKPVNRIHGGQGEFPEGAKPPEEVTGFVMAQGFLAVGGGTGTGVSSACAAGGVIWVAGAGTGDCASARAGKCSRTNKTKMEDQVRMRRKAVVS